MTSEAQARYAAKQIEKDARAYWDRRTEIVREWRQRNHEKMRAHSQVAYAIHAGKLVRPDACGRCSKPCKPEASHDDYSKPLDVEWLCRQCHAEKDRKTHD